MLYSKNMSNVRLSSFAKEKCREGGSRNSTHKFKFDNRNNLNEIFRIRNMLT